MKTETMAFVLGLAALSGTAQAEAWRSLDGAAIQTALEGRKLTYDSGAWQDFRASGRTLYNAGQDSWGNWGVRGDQYCSQWPPNNLWACYEVEGSENGVRFIGESGDVTRGTYSD
ncbi:MAG: hypothetical protein GJ676_04015 [Rhodobacteraceae bacterium]|nr:hypothetical protein [Paracoccaceae bacterium]